MKVSAHFYIVEIKNAQRSALRMKNALLKQQTFLTCNLKHGFIVPHRNKEQAFLPKLSKFSFVCVQRNIRHRI